MTLIAEVATHFESLRGKKTISRLGVIDKLLIRRYALAVGETNRLYYDLEFAKMKGYPDIVAPPNLIVSIMEWGVGEEEANLNPDGLANSVLFLDERFSGVRIMGGGEEKIFYLPIIAGTHINLESEITDTYTKEGKKGLIAFLVMTNTYKDQEGNVLCICKRTMLAR